MKEDVKKWFDKAESDYRLSEDNYEMGNEAAAMFFLHQAAEKSMKALQISREGEKSFSHNLVSLSNKIEIKEEYLDLLAQLNPFYTGFRYPDEDSPEVENPEYLIEKTGDLLSWIENCLEE